MSSYGLLVVGWPLVLGALAPEMSQSMGNIAERFPQVVMLQARSSKSAPM